MLISDIPTRITTIWGAIAGGAYIRTVPVASQIGIQDGAASWETGFPPDNFIPLNAGGVPPFGQDVNGVMNVLSAWNRWFCAGGAVFFDASFSADVGGYPDAAIIDSDMFGEFWLNAIDGNTANPNSDPTGWVRGSWAGTFTTGDVKFTLKTTADFGWVFCNDGTIGSVTSGASVAAANTQKLFNLLFANVTDTYAPLLTSSGVATTRAAQGSAAAAWAANALTGAENGPHTHTGPVTGAATNNGGGSLIAATVGNANTGSSGSGTPHNTMQPTSFLNCMIKL